MLLLMDARNRSAIMCAIFFLLFCLFSWNSRDAGKLKEMRNTYASEFILDFIELCFPVNRVVIIIILFIPFRHQCHSFSVFHILISKDLVVIGELNE